jgi:hypothetical protein
MTKGLTTMKVERDTRRALDVEEAVMHLGVVHTIRDRAAWDRAFFADEGFPPGFTLIGTVTQDDVSRAICIWDAPSVDELQRALDGMFGDAAVNDCFVADPSRSAGMPAPQTTAAQG